MTFIQRDERTVSQTIVGNHVHKTVPVHIPMRSVAIFLKPKIVINIATLIKSIPLFGYKSPKHRATCLSTANKLLGI